MNWRPLLSEADFEAALPEMDLLDITTIAAPLEAVDWTLEQSTAYGELVHSFGLTIAEVAYWGNLLGSDVDRRAEHVGNVRRLLRNADAMGAGCVVTLSGSFSDEGPLSAHPDNWTEGAQAQVAANCEEILTGLDLSRTRYALEPWCNGFFHEPDAIHAFFEHRAPDELRLHLDQMNMLSPTTYFRSGAVIDRTFELLSGRIVAVHAKDLRWHPSRMFLHLDEVVPGDGVLDYARFFTQLARLDREIPVLTEHWDSVDDYHRSFDHLRRVAVDRGLAWVARR